MQIIERSMLGLRSAMHAFESPDRLLRVTLFPMVHVGEEKFYREVYSRASNHDIVMIEGVSSPTVSIITSSYRWINKRRLGLVIQPKFPTPLDGKPRLVHADISPEEFRQNWKQLPVLLRLAVVVTAPIFGIYRRMLVTRRALARDLEMEDKVSSEEILRLDPRYLALKRAILHERDQRLLEVLNKEIRSAGANECSIAIVYGAGHMRAIIKELMRRQFRTTGSNWQTIMSF